MFTYQSAGSHWKKVTRGRSRFGPPPFPLRCLPSVLDARWVQIYFPISIVDKRELLSPSITERQITHSQEEFETHNVPHWVNGATQGRPAHSSPKDQQRDEKTKKRKPAGYGEVRMYDARNQADPTVLALSPDDIFAFRKITTTNTNQTYTRS